MKHILIYTLLLISCSALGQKKKGYAVIGFYNIENLFDTLDTPGKDDKEFLPTSDNKWNTQRYHAKLVKMTEAIAPLGGVGKGNGPAVLGLCEVETKAVVEDLAKTGKLKKGNYGVVFYEGPDERGIDVALMYQKDFFQVTSSKSHTLTLPNDTSFHTRDQLVVTGKLMGEEIHFIVCHWPSRRGGQDASKPHRAAAAKLARSIIDSLYTLNANAKIILMGDLNDDPIDESVKTIIGTTHKREEASKEKFYNPMENMHASGRGTLTYKKKWNLFDQMLISPALMNLDQKSLCYTESGISEAEFLREKEGDHKGEPYRTYVGTKYLGGYSDHLPVYLHLLKRK